MNIFAAIKCAFVSGHDWTLIPPADNDETFAQCCRNCKRLVLLDSLDELPDSDLVQDADDADDTHNDSEFSQKSIMDVMHEIGISPADHVPVVMRVLVNDVELVSGLAFPKYEPKVTDDEISMQLVDAGDAISSWLRITADEIDAFSQE